jgi:hypothetical protein
LLLADLRSRRSGSPHGGNVRALEHALIVRESSGPPAKPAKRRAAPPRAPAKAGA